jgi:hypothetical protein
MGLLLLFTFSLAIMQPPMVLFGLLSAPPDLVFVLLAVVWAAALLLGQVRLNWHPVWWALLLYFAAMAISVPFAANPVNGTVKLGSQAYLLSLPIIANSLIGDHGDLKRLLRCWIAAAALVGAVGIATLLLFILDADHPLLRHLLFHFGTLPPGQYPRVRLTFVNANMLCNYLSVSLMILLAAAQARWISVRTALLVGSGLLLSAVFTISPGLGGLALVVGVWLWLTLPERRPVLRRLALSGGTAAALLFVAAMAVTPIVHPTAPYLIELPLTDAVLAPSGRLMIWADAIHNFLADPLTGRGLAAEAVLVRYQDPTGNLQRLTDAHNSYLSLAVQCGVAGLAGVLLVTFAAWKAARPYRIIANPSHAITVGLAIAFLGGFGYQGLGGSFEDARHLWLLLGLIIASQRLEAGGQEAAMEPRPRPG